MYKIRKGDTVCVIKGKDIGKKGRILKIFPETRHAIVEGINFVKKHKRRAREGEQAGIVSIEAPISIANLALFCKHCNHPSRVGFRALTDGTKSRFCKACKEPV